MDLEEPVANIRQMIRYRDQLTNAERRGIRSGVAAEEGTLIQLARGCYISRANWKGLHGEGRQIAVALAHSDRASRPPVLSHYTAAALWGLPLFMFTDTRIHEIVPPGDTVRSSKRVLRHVGELPDTEVSRLAGVLLTSPLRTILDVARNAGAEVGVGCIDAALQREFFANRGSGIDTQEAWREAVLLRLEAMPGRRGVKKAERVLRFADGQAESVLESVGRLRFARAGIRTRLQSPVRGRSGYNYFVDFELPDHDAFAEVDGEAKYFDAQVAQARNPRDLIRMEKEREDWIRGTTKKPIYRFGYRHLVTQQDFEERFASFGVFGDADVRRLANTLP